MRLRQVYGRLFIPLALILSSAVFYSPAQAQTDEADKDKLENLQNEREGLQAEIGVLEDKIKGYQRELNSKRGEITSLKNEIARINAQVNKLNLEIKKTENQIYITRLDIKETQADIKETELNIDEKREVLADLLREFYRLDDESVLERFLKYNTLTEAVKRTEHLLSFQDKLAGVLDATKILKNNLENKEGQLTNNKKELENKNSQLAVQKSAQQTEKTRKDSILKVTKGEEAKYQQLLSQVEQEQAELLKRLAKIEEQILIQRNFVSYFQAGEIPKPGTKLFIWPEDNAKLTQGYGMTRYAKRGVYGGQGHNGIDMTSGLARPVKAAAQGRVVAKGIEVCQDYVRPACNGYWGNWVAVQHPGGLITLYSHLSRPSAKSVGEEIAAGEVIGYEGATGNVTGPHLHFSVFTEFFTYKDPKTGDLRISYNYDKTLNPLDYL